MAKTFCRRRARVYDGCLGSLGGWTMIAILRTAALAATAIGGALVAGPAFTQGGGPVARYTLDAGTIGGMGAMARGGGGMGAAMAMMRGGGGPAHELVLRLGSTRTPTGGAPQATHFLPQTARFGPSLPLYTPPPGRTEVGSYGGQMPKGRLLLFWGCGEHAPAGQPVVIDFSKMAKGQVPPGLFAQAVAVADQWRITQAGSKSYGEWPNPEDPKPVPGNASLLGAHKVTGNYTPDIAFTLDQDFMAPIRMSSRETGAGAHAMSWNAVPAATGYYAWTMSARGTDRKGDAMEMVWWTSSASQQFGGPMWDWLSPAAVAKLIGAKTVMPPSQTSCTVPAEVVKASGEAIMASLYAYGPERNFAFPPRPANAKTPWKPEWIARARFRSMSMNILGMDMGAMGGMGSGGYGDADEADGEGSASARQPAKPKCGKGLGALARRAAGLCE